MQRVQKIIEIKVVILGDSGVGKTCMLLRYLGQQYTPFENTTIGAEYHACYISKSNLLVKLHIWDTAGQERFKAILPVYYRKTDAAILMYDITCPRSFEMLKIWVSELKTYVDTPVNLFVVGGKQDLADQRLVPKHIVIKYCNNIGAAYYECSALRNKGITDIFDKVATETAEKLENGKSSRNNSTKNEMVISGKHMESSEDIISKGKRCC